MAKIYLITESQMNELRTSVEMSALRLKSGRAMTPQTIDDVFRSMNYAVCAWISKVGRED